MRIRHKPPTLVSMWMLDVFCCALGCVTLLFLLNSRMAADTARASRAALSANEAKLAEALSTLGATRLRLTDEEAARGKLAAALTEMEGLKLALDGDVTGVTKSSW